METHEREDYYNAPINIEDAASLLRRRCPKDGTPYVTTMIRLNNRKVDNWKKEVLRPISDQRGMVPSGRVWHSWQLYEQGKSIEKYIDLKNEYMIPDVSEEVIDFWKDFFENLNIEEMYHYGTGVVSTGWRIIDDVIKRWYAVQKWERLFSNNPKNPLWWERNYHSHTDYLNGKVLPFWDNEIFTDIKQKVRVILTVQAEFPRNFLEDPDSLISMKEVMSILQKDVKKNERPSVITITKLNNQKVSDWNDLVGKYICDDKGMITRQKVHDSWYLYDEGLGIKKYVDLKENKLIYSPPKEVVNFWKEFFEEKNIEDIHAYGTGTISTGWQILQNYMKAWFTENKWTRFFSKNPENPLWCEQNRKEHSDYIEGKILPFWNEQKLEDIQQKVGALLMIQVEPTASNGGFI